MPSFRANALIALHDVSGSRHVADARHDDYLLGHLYLLDIYSVPDFARAVELGDWQAALKQNDADLAILAANPEGPEIARYAREELSSRTALERLSSSAAAPKPERSSRRFRPIATSACALAHG